MTPHEKCQAGELTMEEWLTQLEAGGLRFPPGEGLRHDILRFIEDHPRPITAREVADWLELSRASTSSSISKLFRLGYLKATGDTPKRYWRNI